ncbi:MAG: glycosyltransferase family 39 protein [Elusimicrobiota bacterium]
MAASRGLRPEWPLAAAFILLAAALRPWTADVPLNDDWSYLIPTLRLAEEHILRLTGDSPTTHVLHVLVGALWTKVWGGGIGGLKVLMLLWHFAGSLFLLRLLVEENVPESTALLGTLTYAGNPILLTLSATFMTDIPYLTLSIISLFFYLRALRGENGRWILYGSLAAAGAYLIKQLGLFLPAALTLTLWRGGRLRRGSLLLAWTPLAAAFAGHQLWYHFIHGPTWAGTADGVYLRAFRLLGDPCALLKDGSLHAAGMFLCLALFLLPLLAGLAFSRPRKTRRRRPGLPLALYGIAALGLVAGFGKFPYLENSIYDTGLGTPTLAGTIDKTAGIFGWPLFWEGVTAVALLGGWALLTRLRSVLTERRREPAVLLLAFAALLQLAVPLLTTRYFDRYTLYGLPALIGLLCLITQRERFSARAAWSVLALGVMIGIAGTADYIAWNQAKWRLGRSAIASGTEPAMIEGGHDWDLYWTYEKEMAKLLRSKPLQEIREWEWLETQPRAARISFTPPKAGAAAALEEPYETPLRLGPAYLYLYRSAQDQTTRDRK